MGDVPPPVPGAAQAFDEAPCGLLVVTTSGTILRVNATFCRWVGEHADALVNQRRLQDMLTMGGRIFHQTHWAPMLEMQGSLAEVKLDIRRHDGHTFPVLMNAIRRHGDGPSYDVISIMVAEERNKYERELLASRKRADELLGKEREAQAALRASQARLQQAMQIGAICVWDVDPATGVRRYGDEVALLLGFDAPEAVDEAMFLAAVAPEDRVQEAALLQRSLQQGEAYRFTFRLNGRDGIRRVVVASGQSFDPGPGSPAEFFGTLADISESDRLREAAEDRALFAEQMVGIVSHDLRNPLQTILLSTQVMDREPTPKSERMMRTLDAVGRAARRAKRLIADLLDFTAARVGRGILVQRRPVDFHGTVARAVEELALAFPQREILHLAAGPPDAAVDADRIAQLIGNLVGNAITYGTPDRPITVTSAVTDDHASLAVHNEGEPIAAEQMPRLFEPMVRGADVAGLTRSVGLGLFIVRAIAQAHGGRVEVASSAPLGTTFRFECRRWGA